MRGEYKLPRYGLSTQWLIFVRDRNSAAQVPPGSSGPGPNFGQNVAMPSTTININTISGTSWTAAVRAVTSVSAPAVEMVPTGTTQRTAISNSESMHNAKPTSLLKPIPVPTQTQPAMPTISIIESTTAVSTSTLSSTSALSFTANRPGSQFTGQFNLLSSSTSSRFQLMKVETQRQSVSSSIKFSPHTTVQIEEVNIPLDEARQTAMISI